MARPKADKSAKSGKDVKKDKEHREEVDNTATEQAQTVNVNINVEDYQRTRDRVVYTLTALQSAVADLQRAFVNHADTVLKNGGVTAAAAMPSMGLGLPNLTGLLDLGAAQTAAAAAPAATGTAAPAAAAAQKEASVSSDEDEGNEKTKKKQKRKHDPNAPKRPLTPYFLYMQQNRHKIAGEMPDEKRPQDVSNEGTKRWQEMPEQEKAVYTKQYTQNLEIYRAKMKAYKSGLPIPDDATVAADLQLQQDVERDVAKATDAAISDAATKGDKSKAGKAAESSDDEESGDEPESSSESSSSPDEEQEQPQQAAAPPKRRRRTAKEMAADREKEAQASKKKPANTRSAKKEDQTPVAARKDVGATETPSKTPKSGDKGQKKRKRKSEVAAE